MISFGQKVKQERLLRNWTIYRLAKLSGVSQGTIKRVERGDGRHNLSVLLALAKTLEFDTLLDRDSI